MLAFTCKMSTFLMLSVLANHCVRYSRDVTTCRSCACNRQAKGVDFIILVVIMFKRSRLNMMSRVGLTAFLALLNCLGVFTEAPHHGQGNSAGLLTQLLLQSFSDLDHYTLKVISAKRTSLRSLLSLYFDLRTSLSPLLSIY